MFRRKSKKPPSTAAGANTPNLDEETVARVGAELRGGAGPSSEMGIYAPVPRTMRPTHAEGIRMPMIERLCAMLSEIGMLSWS